MDLFQSRIGTFVRLRDSPEITGIVADVEYLYGLMTQPGIYIHLMIEHFEENKKGKKRYWSSSCHHHEDYLEECEPPQEETATRLTVDAIKFQLRKNKTKLQSK
jgi:hypothetical protein